MWMNEPNIIYFKYLQNKNKIKYNIIEKKQNNHTLWQVQ